jgi:hypothetical protein
MSDAPSESEARSRSPREDIFTFVPDNDARNVSTESRLQIAGKASPVPIKVRWMLVLYGWRSMEKTQNLNDVQHRTGQEMYREVRATLTSIKKFELKRDQREDLVREVNETVMGIRPSSSLEMKNSNSRAIWSSGFRHRNVLQATQSQQQNDQTSIILPLRRLDWILHAQAI